MSKRLCISLLHAPRRTQQSLPPCAFQILHHDLQPHSKHHNRPFSSSHRYNAVSASRQVTQRKQPQASIKLAQRKQVEAATRDGSFLEHLGLQDTFVYPTKPPLLPDLFTNPRGRIKIERKRFINWFNTRIFAWAYAWYSGIPHERALTPKIAKEIYPKMYEGLASGDLSGLESKVSAGMLSNLRGRIGQRPPGQMLQWTLHKYLSQPTLISYFPSLLPTKKGEPPTAIIQAVIKFRTRQSLVKLERRRTRDPQTGRSTLKEVVVDPEGIEVEEDRVEKYRIKNAKDVTEYVVLQKFIKQGKPGDWHIWGTTEETGLEKLKKMAKMQEKALEAQRAQRAAMASP